MSGRPPERGFKSRLDALLAYAQHLGTELGLVVFDLDDFNTVDDDFGHAAGDELLRWVADVLRATVRADDAVGRLGGDEFAAVIAAAIAERLSAALAERVSVSVGVAVFPRDGETADALHSAGDARLYADKRTDGLENGTRSLSRRAAP